MFLIDTYSLRARVAPVFLVLIPAVLALAVWVPGALSINVGASSLVVSVALSMLVAQFGRDFGKRKEPALWKSWGGPPTSQFLRHRDTSFNRALRIRCHTCLSKLRPDLKLPSPEQELNDPEDADAIYGAATRYLISKTRDVKKFPLIFKENVNYGFRRNLWGLKPIGIAISLSGMFTCGLHAWLAYQNNRAVPTESVGGLLISLGVLLLWICWVTPSTIRVAAEAYAERLLEACEQL